VTVAALSAALTLPLMADDKKEKKPADKQPSESEMMAMMTEMAKPGENHKMLESSVGSWSYTVKWWMSPDAPPMESTGTSVGRSVMGGRYVITDHTGKMQMPGADGKMMDMGRISERQYFLDHRIRADGHDRHAHRARNHLIRLHPGLLRRVEQFSGQRRRHAFGGHSPRRFNWEQVRARKIGASTRRTCRWTEP
jgi:hypothetical protein